MVKINSENWDKYAKNYHEHIISPLQSKINNPIFHLIKNIQKSEEMIAADLGTGIGDLLPFLSEQFNKVYALDFSENMISIAKEKNKHAGNIIFKRCDMKELTKLKLNLDVAIAVNSIINPSISDIKIILSEINKSIKEGGLFIGVFPSMESIIHYAMLVYERELENSEELQAIIKTKIVVEWDKYCFIRGLYDDCGEKQKFFYEFELKNKLEEAGFKNIKIKKVQYPWGEHGDFDMFKDKLMMWDWFIIATK